MCAGNGKDGPDRPIRCVWAGLRLTVQECYILLQQNIQIEIRGENADGTSLRSVTTKKVVQQR